MDPRWEQGWSSGQRGGGGSPWQQPQAQQPPHWHQQQGQRAAGWNGGGRPQAAAAAVSGPGGCQHHQQQEEQEQQRWGQQQRGRDQQPLHPQLEQQWTEHFTAVLEQGWSSGSRGASGGVKRQRPAEPSPPPRTQRARHHAPAAPAPPPLEVVPARQSAAAAATQPPTWRRPLASNSNKSPIDTTKAVASLDPEQRKRLETLGTGSKGIGLKLLMKMGFDGTLGTRPGHGLSRPIEVTVRKNRMGLRDNEAAAAATAAPAVAMAGAKNAKGGAFHIEES